MSPAARGRLPAPAGRPIEEAKTCVCAPPPRDGGRRNFSRGSVKVVEAAGATGGDGFGRNLVAANGPRPKKRLPTQRGKLFTG